MDRTGIGREVFWTDDSIVARKKYLLEPHSIAECDSGEGALPYYLFQFNSSFHHGSGEVVPKARIILSDIVYGS